MVIASGPNSESERLLTLAAKRCDQRLSRAEQTDLEGLLATSPENLRLYIRYMMIHAGLVWSLSDRLPGGRFPCTSATKLGRVGATLKLFGLLAVAAAILAAALLSSMPLPDDLRKLDRPVAVEAERLSPSLGYASVTRVADNARWAVTPQFQPERDELRELDVVGVTEGEIELTFGNGAKVTLYAPAMVEILSRSRARAIRGRLRALVDEGAEGFTIETPQGSVIDLGTEFGVEVGDEGATDVVVFRGMVDFKSDQRAGEFAEEPVMRLTSGQALRISEKGTRSRIVSISGDWFSSTSYGGARAASPDAFIAEVSDNIGRDGSNWSYYEILYGGMREDARAFVDRDSHEWNGLDPSGMPAFLLGGDYVKTFNNDKVIPNHELSVRLNRPCRLFVLFDDRAAVPNWLSSDFRDTGYDVGIDVGPFRRVDDGHFEDRRKTGKGAGVEVDDVMSIWERVVLEPLVVRLGPSNPKGLRNLNMYGIVATPLAE